ncbi:MAG: thiamine biosynthesis protein ThiS [Thermoprotei archaeon]|nr:MAG: thiamine biosynthesis protein ThiS [Thermoprotei archaeon]
MKIRIRIGSKNLKELDVSEKITVEDLLLSLGLNPIEYVTIRNGEVISEKEVLREGDTITLYPVVSGGRVRI